MNPQDTRAAFRWNVNHVAIDSLRKLAILFKTCQWYLCMLQCSTMQGQVAIMAFSDTFQNQE
eukprot:m.338239 g.338239  ORF g.338239 m.338239 type:complete len:62 (+) comp18350_c0_seq1:843-1028(+)